MSLPQNGTAAPGFTLASAADPILSLSDLRGRNVVLVLSDINVDPLESMQPQEAHA